MDSVYFTKIAGVVLCALLLIFGTKVLIDLNAEGGHGHDDVAGYTLLVPEAASQKAKTGEAAPGDDAAAANEPSGDFPANVVAMAAATDAKAGESIFKKCKACHSAEQGGANMVGPALWGVVNRAKASVDGFKYSEALRGKGGAWTLEDLALFLRKPRDYVPGTNMIFTGIAKDKDLANILAYLSSLK